MWFITDLGSKHGTYLNGHRLGPSEQTPLAPGDIVRLGPWTFRVRLGRPAARAIVTVDDSSIARARVERLNDHQDATSLARRLSLLVEAAAKINAVAGDLDLAEAVLRPAVLGSGFARGALLREFGSPDEVEVIASWTREDTRAEGFQVSRTLIREASRGHAARLSGGDYSHSVSEMGIHTAICVPFDVDGAVVGYLYLDAREEEARADEESADYCLALARLCGLAFSNLRRAELEHKQRTLETQLEAAREAQQLLLPPQRGGVGRLRYSLYLQPGLVVAGDLFDIVPLSDGHVGIVFGDVTGEGVSAGLIMAAVQSHIHARLLQTQSPSMAVEHANRYLCAHSASNRFVTLWVGVLDVATGKVRYVDAGHGLWTVVSPEGASQASDDGRSIPIGIEADYQFNEAELSLTPTHRLVLLSDGIIEQRSPDGLQFKMGRVKAVLESNADADSDPERVIEAVRAFAGSRVLDDDATVASIRLEG